MSEAMRETPRPDARAKINGTATYTQDALPAHALHGAVVYSDRPSARILSIDASAALSLPGVQCVLTAADVPEALVGVYKADEPILARDVVRYVGEPIAFVAAESRELARLAARRVQVGYEDLPFVTDLSKAVLPESHQVHEGVENIFERSRIANGDVDEAFTSAHFVHRTVTRSHRAHQAYIEPRVATAEFVGDHLHVTMSSQAPFQARSGLAKYFGLPLTKVTVTVPTLGGGFGGKLHLGMAPAAALLARRTGRPVQVLCTREEEMQSPAPRENSVVEIESAVSETGEILGRRAVIYLDSGAYAYDTPPISSLASFLASGPYRVGALEVLSCPVYTNTVPTGSFRAPSGLQLAYAVESHMEDLAEMLQRDGIDFRRKHLHQNGDTGPTGQNLDNPGAAELFEFAVRRLDEWRADAAPPRPGWLRGHGIGCAWWSTSAIGGAASVILNEDGSVEVHSGATEIGTGAVTVGIGGIAAEVLGIDATHVAVRSGSTQGGIYDFGSAGGRTTYGVGTAVARAAGELQDLLRTHYARTREVAADELTWVMGELVNADGQTLVSLAELAGEASGAGGPLVVSARFQPDEVKHDSESFSGWQGALNEPTYHVHLAEIEVEAATGRIEISRFLAAHDVGVVLNPLGARGQVEGGVVQGIGYALSEEVLSTEMGKTLNVTLHDYRIPTALDVPDLLEVHFLQGHSAMSGYRGMKGIGEATIIPVTAAIGSALRDAVGVQPDALPMSPERVLGLLNGAKEWSA